MRTTNSRFTSSLQKLVLVPAACLATAGGDDGGDKAGEQRHKKEKRVASHGPRFLVVDWDGDDGQDGRKSHKYM